MFSSVLIRYDEIGTKGKNRLWFEQMLAANIRRSLEGLATVDRFHGRLVATLKAGAPVEETLDLLGKIPGISSFSPAVRLPVSAEWEEVEQAALTLADQALAAGKTVFRVTCNRSNKNYPGTSIEIQKKLAAFILISRDKQFTVSMHQHTFNLELEIDKNDIFVFSERCRGVLGLPVGSAGDVLTLLSGGIDSPVASYLTMRRGCRVHYISFHSPPYTGEESMRKLRDLAASLKRYQGVSTRLFVAPLIDIQLLIRARCVESYRTVLFRRMMFRIAEEIAKKHGFKALVTGESISQVASQTLENLGLIGSAVKTLPVIRPLITNEKQETIEIAKRIGTYDISIRPCADSCTAFLPKNPVIRGKIPLVLEEEEKLKPEIDALIAASIEQADIIDV